MRLYLKNQMIKYLAVIIMQLLLLICLYQARGDGLFVCFNILLGNEPIIWVVEKMGLVIMILLLQVLNGNVLVYYLQNKAYFSIRAVSISEQCKLIFEKIWMNVIVFMICDVLVFLICQGMLHSEMINPVILLLGVVKALGKLFLFSCVQTGLMIWLSQEKAVLVFVIILVAFSFGRRVTFVLHVEHDIARLAIVALIYIIISCLAMIVIKKMYSRRELYRVDY